ncbi:hypothetical protein [Allostreptomyces psammosilenae]|uniref:Uncharacterized protein n=1 Tax=Allostreptomyces psammosilenae TaxID=1892865 RepID=A0A853A2E1_9ACTN|nr:hypothetical protein [Allostreptomyces psammosilenae]NYI04682.1 hypothetical protein [Allostreptomyces psammosilenae]
MTLALFPPVALRPPAPGGWDFSDYPYGLEPLTLPLPDAADSPSGGVTPEEVEDAFRTLLGQTRQGMPTTAPAHGTEELERLFWFRWMIGHHVSFTLWRLTAGCLARVAKGEGDQEALAAAITAYVRAYCGMLLYTGSCPRSLYQASIRPSMYRMHSTFSGTWALDYLPVRSLFRGRRTPPVVASAVDALVREVRLSNRIHFGVSSKLVTGGRSLLQQSIDAPDAAQPRAWGALFDCYFLTLRAPVSAPEIAAQLLRRVKAIAIDLATNGLYPGGDQQDEPPAELRHPDVAACERDLTGSLIRVGALATGLPLADLDPGQGTG